MTVARWRRRHGNGAKRRAQRAAAERNLALATDAANSLVFDLAQKFRDVSGVPASLIKSILDRAGDLQEKLLGGGQSSPDLLRSQAAALDETSTTLLTLGDTKGALEAAQKAAGVFETLLKQQPDSTDYQRELSVSYEQGRRREDGAGRPCGRAEGLRGQPRDHETGWRNPIPATPAGSAIFRCRTNKIGDVKTAQGDLAGALKAYQDSLAIADRLAKSDPGNAGWQRDLSVSYEQDRRREDGAGRPCGRAEGLSGQPRDHRPAGEIRSRQRRLAARSLGVVRQDRRREDGAGRPCGRAEGLSGQPRDRRPAGEIRSRQRRLAARSFGVV